MPLQLPSIHSPHDMINDNNQKIYFAYSAFTRQLTDVGFFRIFRIFNVHRMRLNLQIKIHQVVCNTLVPKQEMERKMTMVGIRKFILPSLNSRSDSSALFVQLIEICCTVAFFIAPHLGRITMRDTCMLGPTTRITMHLNSFSRQSHPRVSPFSRICIIRETANYITRGLMD